VLLEPPRDLIAHLVEVVPHALDDLLLELLYPTDLLGEQVLVGDVQLPVELKHKQLELLHRVHDLREAALPRDSESLDLLTVVLAVRGDALGAERLEAVEVRAEVHVSILVVLAIELMELVVGRVLLCLEHKMDIESAINNISFWINIKSIIDQLQGNSQSRV